MRLADSILVPISRDVSNDSESGSRMRSRAFVRSKARIIRLQYFQRSHPKILSSTDCHSDHRTSVSSNKESSTSA